jgi:hypothetical protein
LPFVKFGDVLAVDEYLPGVGLEQSDQMFEQDAFAGTRATEDHMRLSGGNAHAHAPQDLLRA